MKGWIVVLAVVLTACSDNRPGAAPAEPPRKPNIIYILADDLGYGDIGAYGQTRTRTPHLDALARGGMVFTQHYSGSTVCAPSRAALLTGRHMGSAQIRGNYELGGFLDHEERGQRPLRPGTQTLGSLLQQQGYTTAAIGKWGLGGPTPVDQPDTGPNTQGFDHFFGYLDQKQAHSYYPTHLWRNRDRVALNNEYRHPHPGATNRQVTSADYRDYIGQDYAPDLITAEALEFMGDNADRPFFLYLAYPSPHAALQVPDSYMDAYDGQWQETPSDSNSYTPHPKPRAARAGMISHMDEDIGEVMAKLRQLGLEKDTLVIFSSDNGPAPEGGSDVAFFQASGPLRGIKRDLYEGGIRVPMIANWPGKIAAGVRSEHISAFWDVLPTLAQLTGAPVPEGVQGLSFLPSLFNEGEQKQHPYLYWEFAMQGGKQAVRMGDWKAVKLNARSNPHAPIELYNLAADIGETRNVADQHPDIVARAAAYMAAAHQPSAVASWNFPGAHVQLSPRLSSSRAKRGDLHQVTTGLDEIAASLRSQ
ncbi:arylsulfatase [Porticoccus sp. GXU_MW_L64]